MIVSFLTTNLVNQFRVGTWNKKLGGNSVSTHVCICVYT